MLTFDKMPQVVESIHSTLSAVVQELKELRAQQPINEQPINGEELRKRLSISRPTEIAMRKRGKLPYMLINGHYRYQWQEVLKALTNN